MSFNIAETILPIQELRELESHTLVIHNNITAVFPFWKLIPMHGSGRVRDEQIEKIRSQCKESLSVQNIGNDPVRVIIEQRGKESRTVSLESQQVITVEKTSLVSLEVLGRSIKHKFVENAPREGMDQLRASLEAIGRIRRQAPSS